MNNKLITLTLMIMIKYIIEIDTYNTEYIVINNFIYITATLLLQIFPMVPIIIYQIHMEVYAYVLRFFGFKKENIP